MPDQWTIEDALRANGIEDRQGGTLTLDSPSQWSIDDALRANGISEPDTIKPIESGNAFSRFFINAAKKTTPGLVFRAAGAVGPPTDQGTIANLFSELVAFGVDPATFATGGLASILGKGVTAKLGEYAVAKGLVGAAARTAPAMVEMGSQLGMLETVKGPLRQIEETGTIDPLRAIKESGQAAAAGTMFGAAGKAFDAPIPKIAAEVAAMAASGPVTELRGFTKEDWIGAGATVGGFKLEHVIIRALRKLKPDAKPEEVKAAIEAEIGPEQAAKVESAIVAPRVETPSPVKPGENLAPPPRPLDAKSKEIPTLEWAAQFSAAFPEQAAKIAAMEGPVTRSDVMLTREPGAIRDMERSLHQDARNALPELLRKVQENATQERVVPQDNQQQYPNGDQGGQTATTGGGDRAIEGGQVEAPQGEVGAVLTKERFLSIQKTAGVSDADAERLWEKSQPKPGDELPNDIPGQGATGGMDRARPDLAMPVTNPEARRALNQADINRNAAGEPKPLSDVEVRRIATERMAVEGPALKQKMLEGDWVPADNGVDTAVQIRIMNESGEKYARERTIDAAEENVRLGEAYRGGRTSVGRELRQGREDIHQEAVRASTPEDQKRLFALTELFAAPKKVQKELDTARDRVQRIKREVPKEVEPKLVEAPKAEEVVEPTTAKPVEPIVEVRKPIEVSRLLDPSEAMKTAQKRIDDLWTEIAPKWTGGKLFANPVAVIPEMLADGVRLAHAYVAREGVRFADFFKDVKQRIGNERAKQLRTTLSQAWKQAQAERTAERKAAKAVEPQVAHKIKPEELQAPTNKPLPPKGFRLEQKPKVQGPETEKSYVTRLASAQKRYDDLISAWAKEVEKTRGKLSAMGHDVDSALRGTSTPDALLSFVRDAHAIKASVPDKLFEWWINAGLLSGPATNVTNMTGNVAHAAWYFTAEKTTDAILSSIARGLGMKSDGAYFQELGYAARALMKSRAKAWTNFLTTWNTEQPQFYLARGLEFESPLGYHKASIAGKFGRVVRASGRLMTAVDDMTKTGVAEAETAALAYRQSRLEGLTKKTDIERRMDELINDPYSEAHKRATDTAIRLAFQTRGKALQKFTDFVHDMRGLRYLFPFITTPFGILSTGIRKSPFGSLKLAKEMFKAAKSGDWSHIPIRAAEQTIAWGATLALMYTNNPSDPWITGSDDPNNKYSVKIGGQWFPYGGLEPFATVIGLMVDSVNKVHRGADLFESMKAPMNALLDRVDNQTFFAGISDLLKAVQYGEVDYALQFASKFPSSWIPNLVRAPIRASDENVPERRVWGKNVDRAERMLHRGLQSLEVMPDYPKWDLWGRPVPKDGGPLPGTDFVSRVLFRGLPGLGERKYVETIGDRILRRWNGSHPDDPAKFNVPNPYYSKNGETHYFTDAEYDRYVRESGKLTQQRIIAAQEHGAFNMNKPEKRDIERLRDIIESSREKVRNEIKRSLRKGAA